VSLVVEFILVQISSSCGTQFHFARQFVVQDVSYNAM
jgi:hypothetical protein